MLPLIARIDGLRWILWFVFVALFVAMGLINLWWAQPASASDRVTLDPYRLTPARQISYFTRAFWCGVCVFPIMTAMTAYELHQLEIGAKNRMELWFPLAYTYRSFWIVADRAFGPNLGHLHLCHLDGHGSQP